MIGRRLALTVAGALALASCGRQDASGVYVYKTDRQVDLVQLVQASDGSITGRLESLAIEPGGIVEDRSMDVEGRASSPELAFKPGGAGLGGLSPTGVLADGGVTLNRDGEALRARRSSQDQYQKDIAQLRATAAAERLRTSQTQTRQADQAAQAMAVTDATDKSAKLEAVASELGEDAAKLQAQIAAAPDFGQKSADNTARIIQMAGQMHTLAGQARVQLAVSANQVIVDTNQIDIARDRYAADLSQIIRRGAPVALEAEHFCDSPQAAPFGPQCARVKAAETEFESAQVQGSVVFKAYKQTIRTELSRQSELVQRMSR